MPGRFHHEEMYRGPGAADRLAGVRLCLCGAGALGSNLAENLVRQGFRRLRVIDRDRVEEHNISTQVYGEADVGAWKIDILRNRLFRAVGVEIDAQQRELTEQNAGKLLRDADVVIDTFDNSASRSIVQTTCRTDGLICLHAGLNADYGEVVWDESYRVPGDAGADVCDYPLARNLVMLTVAVASDVLVRYALDQTQSSWSITLKDFAVRPMR